MNAKSGMRNAELQWEVDSGMGLALAFRIPHSALRTGRGGAGR